MISIIISTHNVANFQDVSENIKNTIGVEFEIIGIENHKKYSICEAYNMGLKKAKFPYICFLHEDILIKTNNWGAQLVELMMADNSIGLIGIAGSKFKSTYPTTGWGNGPFVRKFWRGHHLLGKNLEKHVELDSSSEKKVIEDVLIVDGVFLFTKRDVFNSCGFDESMLTHFHGYDTDFSLQVYFQSYRVIVNRNIEIVHFSYGDLSFEFAKANRLIRKKWRSKLPVATRDYNLNVIELHYFNVLVWSGYLWNLLKRKLKIS